MPSNERSGPGSDTGTASKPATQTAVSNRKRVEGTAGIAARDVSGQLVGEILAVERFARAV
jgi:hypothetical protein